MEYVEIRDTYIGMRGLHYRYAAGGRLQFQTLDDTVRSQGGRFQEEPQVL